MFLLDESTNWPDEYRDKGLYGQKITELRNELKMTKWVGFFSTPKDLATEVLVAMMRRAFLEATVSKDERIRNKALQILKQKYVPYPIPEKPIRYFQDRATELARLRECLSNKNLRMVLICGRGGVGKTALAAKLLSELKENTQNSLPSKGNAVDSIIFVPLGESKYRSPDRIVELISQTLESQAASELKEIWNQEGILLSERLSILFRGLLTRRRYLIFLDNLESVLDDNNRILQEFCALGQFINACLEYDHSALLIVTSRRALLLSPDAETAAIGRRVQISLDEGLPEDDAKNLLKELDTDGRLGIRDAPDEILKHIVQSCQCIPRTLETLIGTLLQKPTWKLGTLITNDVFLKKLIQDPARELYASLSSDQERLVVQTLAVYNKPISREAIQYILPTLQIDEILNKLVNNYIAKYDFGLFWLHPLDQQYIYNQIPQDRVDYSRPLFHKLIAQFYEKMRKPEKKWKAIDDLEPQLEEFQHLVRAGQFDRASIILNEIDREYLSTWGYSQDIIKLRSQLIGHIKDRDLEGLNVGHLGSAYLDSGSTLKAREYYEKALMIHQETKNCFSCCRWLGNLGLTYSILGNSDKAVDCLTAALDIARRINDHLHIGRWLGHLTSVRYNKYLINEQEAIENYFQAISIAQEIDDPKEFEVRDRRFEMIWLDRLGEIYIHQGEFIKSIEQLKGALEIARKIGARTWSVWCLLRLADVYGLLGESDQQVEYYEQVHKVLGEIRNLTDEANVLIKLAEIYAGLGKVEKQQQCYNKAYDIAQNISDHVTKRSLLLMLGDVSARLDNRIKQRECYLQALKIAREEADHTDEYTILLRLAGMHLELGQTSEAFQQFEESLKVARKAGDRGGEAIILSNYANALLRAGEAAKSIMYFELALPFVVEMNDVASQMFILNRMGMASYYMQDMSKAIAYYERNLAKAREIHNREEESVALFNIGDAYHFDDKVDKAILYYKSALALNMPSTNYKSEEGLGIAYMQIGQLNEARKHFKHGVELLENSIKNEGSFFFKYSALGLMLLGLGKMHEGLDIYSQGLNLSPSKEDLYYAIQDLRMLQRINKNILGLTEAIGLIEETFNVSDDGE